jgi:hypothetical protein
MKTWMGVLLSVPVAIVTWLVVGSIPNMMGNYHGWAALFVLVVGPAAALAAGGKIIGVFAAQEAAAEAQRREAERLANQKAEEERRRLEERRLAETQARAAVSVAQGAALSLATLLGGAELDLDRSEDELVEGQYSPFWEAIEEAVSQLNSFEKQLLLIEQQRTIHKALVPRCGHDTPPFLLGIAVLPDPTQTYQRLRTLYRRAQKDRDFASIYEQRRIASKIDRTNAILVAGFTSLGQAIERLGDRVEDSLHQLRVALECRLGDIHSSLEASATAAAAQHRAMVSELSRSRELGSDVVIQMRRDAESRSEHEQRTRRMLDNIQRRRRPAIWET